MHAIVLVGGRGTRLQPLTDTRPKAMLPIVDRPFLEHQLMYLRRHGVDTVTFACGFLPDSIVSYFGEGERVGMQLHYAIEPDPRDTAGAIAFAARMHEPQRFLVVNGDLLTDLDVTHLVAEHERRGALATIALTPVEDPTRYGLVRTDDDGAVLAFVEKPPIEECDTNLINAGTYVLEPGVIDMVPHEGRCNVEREIFPALVGRGLFAIGFDDYWNDIGTHASYLQANLDVIAGDVAGVDGSTDMRGWIAPDADIDPEAQLGPGAIIGSGARVEAGARVSESVVLEGAVIGAGAHVSGVIVGEFATVAPGEEPAAGTVIAPRDAAAV